MARFFVNRPIVAIVISIVTVLLGVVAMRGLPIAQYPEIVPPMVQVTTTFVGASAVEHRRWCEGPAQQCFHRAQPASELRPLFAIRNRYGPRAHCPSRGDCA